MSSKTETKPVDDVSTLLAKVELGEVPREVADQPGEFLRKFYSAWYENGGKVAGRPRNSIRRMRNEWLVGEARIRSLHPKLTGQVKLSRSDCHKLITLFLARWRYVGSRRKDDIVTEDGYIPFSNTGNDKITKILISAIFDHTEKEVDDRILLPTSKADEIESDANAQKILKSFKPRIGESDALITVSSRKTVLGPSPTEGLRLLWHLLEDFSEDELFSNTLFIWIIDIGTRQVEDEGSFDDFYNAGSLALHFSAFANFNSAHDQQMPAAFGPIGKLLSKPDDKARLDRWRWLREHGVVVVRTRGHPEIESLYQEEDEIFSEIRLQKIDVNTEHVLPRIPPSNWVKKLHKLYGTAVHDLAEATLSILYKQELWHEKDHDLLYYAHSSLSQAAAKRIDIDVDDWLLDTETMPSPGKNYDDAFRSVFLAAVRRLSNDHASVGDEATFAAAYLKDIGFQVVRIEDYIKIFGVVEAIDAPI